MPEITYEAIRPLIAEEKVEGSYVKCLFRCPDSGQEVRSHAGIRAERTVKTELKKAAKRSLFRSLRNSVTRAVSSTMGSGIAGHAAREVAYGAMYGSGASSRTTFSESDVQQAVVAAFEKEIRQFRWDEGSGRWTMAAAAPATAPAAVPMAAPAAGAPAASDTPGFEEQLANHPVTEKYDAGVLGRMLVEIACADGDVGDEEREFLGSFVDPELGSVDEIAARPKLSKIELDEVSAGASRDTLLMLAWVVALSDEQLDAAEEQRLGEFADALGIPGEKAAAARETASAFLLEQAIAAAYPGGARDEVKRAEAMLFAAKLGIPSDKLERAEIRYRKKMGIM